MKVTHSLLFLLFLYLLCGFPTVCFGTKFFVEKGSLKCLKDELSENVLVVGDYASPQQEGIPIVLNLEIIDSKGQMFHHSEDYEGSFAFTTDKAGDYLFCFSHKPAPGERMNYDYSHEVIFTHKTGADAKNFAEIATRDHLSKLEVSALRIEEEIQDVCKDLSYLRRREERMRDTNESTNSRVMWLSFTSLSILIALGLGQVYYLRNFFREKKLF